MDQSTRPVAASAGSLPGDAGRVAPQAFEVVVLALLGPEHVDDDVDVVEQRPAGAGLALAADGPLAQTRGSASSIASITLLTWRSLRRRADHEVVGDRPGWCDVEHDDVGRLLVAAAAAAAVAMASVLGWSGCSCMRSAPMIDRHVGDTRWYLGDTDRPDPERVADPPGPRAGASAPLATISVRRTSNDSAFPLTAPPGSRAGTIAAPTASPAPGSPLPLRTSTGTGTSVPNDSTDRGRRSAAAAGTRTRPRHDLGRGDASAAPPRAPSSTVVAASGSVASVGAGRRRARASRAVEDGLPPQVRVLALR